MEVTGISLSEANDTIPICKDFVLYLDYSWSNFPMTGLQSLQLQINLPPSIEYTAASINPAYGSGSLSGNTVTFTITSDLSASSGFGRVGIIMHFKCDSTCSGTIADFIRPAIRFEPIGSTTWSSWNYAILSTHAVALAENRWVIKKDALACQYNDTASNSVLYRIAVINNEVGSYSREGCLSLNVDQFSDQIPTGATFDHIEATPPSPNHAPDWTSWSASGTYATFNPGPTTLTTAHRWYFVYFWVRYPHSSFSSGQFVVNTATLAYKHDPCIPKGSLIDTGGINMCDYHLSGSASKDFIMTLAMPSNPYYYPSNAPGCCGAYKVTFKNTGTAAISNLVIDDPVPGAEHFNSVNTNIPYPGMKCRVYAFDGSGLPLGAVPLADYSAGTVQTYTNLSLPAGTRKVQWAYYGTALPVLYSLSNGISFCFDYTYFGTTNPVNPGDIVTNTATISSNSTTIATAQNSLTISQNLPKIVANKMIAPACATPPNTNGLYWSGMKVHYRMAVANVGNVDATTCSITDLLPAGLTFVTGSSRYDWFVNPNPAWVTPTNPPCSDMQNVTTLSQTGNFNVSTTTVSGRDQVKWQFPTLPHDCDGTPSYLVIEFDALIDSFAVAGPYDNNFTIHTSQTGDLVSDNARFILSATPQANGFKQVGMSANGPFSQYATIPAGGTGYYKLHFKNTGNTPMRNVTMLDILPYPSDIAILPTPWNSNFYAARGNSYAIALTGSNPPTASTSALAAAFSPNFESVANNPKRSEVGSGFGVTNLNNPTGALSVPWTTSWSVTPTVATPALAFTVSSYGNPQLILPQQFVDAIVQVSIPANAKDTACNRFAFEAQPSGYGTNGAYLHTESNPACFVASSDCVPAPASMVAWWPMDDTVGTSVPELTGSGSYPTGAPSNTGLKVGSVGTTPGAYVGNSAHFNGDSNNYIRVQNTSGLDFATGSFSIDAWVKLDSASSDRRTVVSKRQMAGNGTYAQGYTLYVDGTNHLAIQLGYGTNNQSFTMIYQLPYSSWTFVAAVVNRTAAGGSVTLYANGTTETFALTSAWATRSLANTAELWIGRIHEAGTYLNDVMKGSIDELEIFNTAIDSNTMLSLYHAGPAGKCKTTVPCPEICDSISSVPFDHGDVDINYLTFTVVNRKTSPICWMEARFSPTTPASYTGGSLVVTPAGSYTWGYPYTRIPNTGNFGAGASKVLFNLGVNNTLGWSGTITIVVHHCDGDSCIYSRTWTPVKPVNHIGITPDTLLNHAILTHVSIVADPTKFPLGTEFGYITAHVDDSAFAIIGGSGAELQIDTWGDPHETSGDGVSAFKHSAHSALFELDPDTSGPRIDRVIVGLFLKQPAGDTRKPLVHFTIYDTNGEPLSTDSVRADKTVSAVQHQPNAPATIGMDITDVHPNPATSNLSIDYALGTSEDARLELFDILGHSVATLTDGYQAEGSHHVDYNVTALPQGTYFLRLSTRFGQTTSSIRVVR